MSTNFDEIVDTLRRVYVEHTDSSITINPEYVYMTIPAKYICTYHRILIMLADYGVEMLNDCGASCKDGNRQVINCFNMFNAAVAAYKLGQTKVADTIIKYVNSKIKQIYRGEDNSPSIVYPVDEKGHIKAIVSCGENPHFEIDAETGILWQESIEGAETNGVYVLGDKDTMSE
jgi:hypothetical protein|nr:MAG TPA: hypothetical protein [Crassvirales sp.]